jgi:hypothetical protein
VKLQHPVNNAVVAKADGIPIGALHWLCHDCSSPDLTSHPAQDGIRQESPGAKTERSSAPDKEAVLREEVGKVPPRPEERRVVRSPLVADERLLDCDAEQNQTGFCEHQSNDCAGDRLSAKSQRADIQDREDQPLDDGQNTDPEQVKQEDAEQEKGERRQSAIFSLPPN